MWAKTITRKDLLALFDGSGGTIDPVRVNEETLSGVSNDRITALWKGQPRISSIPDVLLVPQIEEDEFFAWVATYLTALRPLTAHCRVMDPQTYREYRLRIREPDLADDAAVIGMVISEALMHISSQVPTIAPTFQVCTSTHSFAFGRLMALGLETFADATRNAWYAVHSAGNSRFVGSAAEAPLAGILALSTRDSKAADSVIYDSLVQIRSSGTVSDTTLRTLLALAGLPPEFEPSLEGPREKRLARAEMIISQLRNVRVPPPIANFAAAYALSRVAPGTLDHAPVLSPTARHLPSALIWYGAIAGLVPDSRVLGYGAGLGRRIQRELMRQEDLVDAPRADIAFAELMVLLKSVRGADVRPTNREGYLEVELVPAVTTVVRWRSASMSEPRVVSGGSVKDQPDMFESKTDLHDNQARYLNDLALALDKAAEATRQLARLYGSVKPVARRPRRKN